MSRVGKLPIIVPNDIKVELNGSVVKITKGSIAKEYNFGDKVVVKFENGKIIVSPKEGFEKSEIANFYGLHRNNIANIVKGLTQPFSITLEINGVGFKAAIVKSNLILTLGYSHDIAFALPTNVIVKIDGNLIVLSSEDKQLLGQVATEIIALRKTEPYKGKGVKVFGKPILRKEGKKK
ncbi:MAG TPA: 50S ribosomal protein L6 [Rickettsiales bacterium]|nr:50S ribosomal protein L6 [Rickettsiales bacterium]